MVGTSARSGGGGLGVDVSLGVLSQSNSVTYIPSSVAKRTTEPGAQRTAEGLAEGMPEGGEGGLVEGDMV